MKLAIITDTFFPSRTSGANQLYDLAVEFFRLGHSIVVLVADPLINMPWIIEDLNGITVIRLKTLDIKTPKYWRRAIAEFLMPFYMIINMIRSPVATSGYEGVIWYSPSIFLGPLAHYMKVKNSCKSYLILRDIFPEWILDLGLIKNGFSFQTMRLVAAYQYHIADKIGIQSEGNGIYFEERLYKKNIKKIGVLQNWLTPRISHRCSINLNSTKLAGRKIFIYTGNMGVAQDLKIFLDLAYKYSENLKIGFIFIGRGDEKKNLETYSKLIKLTNVIFFDEIDSSEIVGLMNQAHFGIVSLSTKHRSHNIPGKFISYMSIGMPVLARINPGNELQVVIENNNVGFASTCNSIDVLKRLSDQLIKETDDNNIRKLNCLSLFNECYSTNMAASVILNGLENVEK